LSLGKDNIIFVSLTVDHHCINMVNSIGKLKLQHLRNST